MGPHPPKSDLGIIGECGPLENRKCRICGDSFARTRSGPTECSTCSEGARLLDAYGDTEQSDYLLLLLGGPKALKTKLRYQNALQQQSDLLREMI